MKNIQTLDDLSRPVFIHLCKDGTFSTRRKGQPVFNGRALPAFSVNTEAQAEKIKIAFCSRQYTEHPQLPGQPWYRWTNFSGTLEALDEACVKMRLFYNKHLKVKR